MASSAGAGVSLTVKVFWMVLVCEPRVKVREMVNVVS